MGYGKHELDTINVFYSPKKLSYYTPSHNTPCTSPQPPLSSFPKVAVVERFDFEQKTQ